MVVPSSGTAVASQVGAAIAAGLPEAPQGSVGTPRTLASSLPLPFRSWYSVSATLVPLRPQSGSDGRLRTGTHLRRDQRRLVEAGRVAVGGDHSMRLLGSDVLATRPRRSPRADAVVSGGLRRMGDATRPAGREHGEPKGDDRRRKTGAGVMVVSPRSDEWQWRDSQEPGRGSPASRRCRMRRTSLRASRRVAAKCSRGARAAAPRRPAQSTTLARPALTCARTLLALEAALASRRASAGSPCAPRHLGGAGDERVQARERVAPVQVLAAVALRLDDDDALVAEAPVGAARAGAPSPPRAATRRRRRSAGGPRSTPC